jgi:Methyltransferase domain
MVICFTSFISLLRQSIVVQLICSSAHVIDLIAVNAYSDYLPRPGYDPQRVKNIKKFSQYASSERQVSKLFRRIATRGVGLSLSSSKDTNVSDPALSRRDMIYSALKIPLFAVASYAYGRILFNFLSSLSTATLFNAAVAPIYPIQHEQRMAKMIQIAFDAASVTSTDTFRVLEVGIGTEARLIRRGLYNDAVHQLSNQKRIRRVEITGLDVKIPSKEVVVTDTNNSIRSLNDIEKLEVSFSAVQSSIAEPLLQYPDGYFDSIVFCFTLCSVIDPTLAVRTMKRLLRRNGGTMAYLEHVAVDDGETDHRLLSYEQVLFDPLQQLLADHCHLHRATESTVDMVLAEDDMVATKYSTLFRERFYVDNMWPVSCQACGVIQASK